MKLILFDIDGTLTDTKQVEDKCFFRAFELVFGLDIRQQQWADLKNVTDWGITEELIQKAFKRNPTQAEYDQMRNTFVKELEKERARDSEQFQEVKGAKVFFDFLKNQADYHLGIATGSWEASARLKLNTIGIALHQIAFSNSDYHKSREAITRHTMEQLKNKIDVPTEQIIYFGDGVWDFKTCQNLGIRFIGIDIEGDGKLEALGATAVFRDYMNPMEIRKEINRIQLP